jgi:hypothetical protein
VYLSITFSDAARDANLLDISLAVDGGQTEHRHVSRTAGNGTDLLALHFAGAYPAGQTLTLVVDALVGQSLLASTVETFTADPTCSARSLTLGNSVMVDAGDGNAPADLAQPPPDTAQPPPDMAHDSTCAHDECTSGSGLASDCSACATAVCKADPYCCDIKWDSTCVYEVKDDCTTKTCP